MTQSGASGMYVTVDQTVLLQPTWTMSWVRSGGAILEFLDQHAKTKGGPVSYAILGDGMDLKVREFNLIRSEVAKTA